jgi:hypothetical protein
MPKKGNGNSVDFALEVDDYTKAVVRMLEQDFKQRLQHWQKQVVYKSAEYTRDRVLAGIPATSEYKLYRDSLEVARITGMDKLGSGYSVRVPIKKRKAKGIDPAKSLLYVKPTRTLSRKRRTIQILAEHSPWTIDTLPFWPSRKDAKVIVRRASAKEVTEISKKLKRTGKLTWKKALSKAGLRPTLKLPRDAKIVPDLAFSAIRLEFGQGGTQPKPHWRPSIRSLVTEMLPRLDNSSELRTMLLAPTSKGWKNWPTRTKGSISSRMAESYIPFMKRLRVKV